MHVLKGVSLLVIGLLSFYWQLRACVGVSLLATWQVVFYVFNIKFYI